MTDHALTAPWRTSAIERYLDAEARLWQYYGLAPRTRFVEIGWPRRARLRVLEVGSGPPVLFIHGTIGPGSWPSLIAGMPEFRSLVLRSSGVGTQQSSPVEYPRGGYPVPTSLTRWPGCSMDSTSTGSTWSAVSIGDVWALSLAEHHPDRVGRVVLLGGTLLVADVPVPDFIRLIRSPIGALIVGLPMSSDPLRSILRQNGHLPPASMPVASPRNSSTGASRSPTTPSRCVTNAT